MAIAIVDYQEVPSFANTTDPKNIASITWQTGDLIVIIGGSEDSSNSIATPVTTGLTYSAIGTALTTSSNCWAHAWQATAAAGGSGTTSLDVSGSAGFGGSAWVFRGHGGLGANARVSSSALTQSLTKTGNNSMVVMGMFDWSASAAGKTGTPTVTNEREDSTVSGLYAIWIADWAGQSSGATAYGVTSGGTAWAKIVIEILDATAAGGNPQWVREQRNSAFVPLSRSHDW